MVSGVEVHIVSPGVQHKELVQVVLSLELMIQLLPSVLWTDSVVQH